MIQIIYESEQIINESIYEYINPEEIEKELKEYNIHLNVKKISETKIRVYFDKKSFLTVDVVFNPELTFILEDYKGKKSISTKSTLKDDIIKTITREL